MKYIELWKRLWRANWLPALVLILLTTVVYLPALRGGFIWDDDAHLTENPCIVGPLGLKEIWTTSAARICPLVLTNFWLQYRLWDLHPFPYHLVNVLMHAATAVVLWRALTELRVPGAWLGAALWAIHPVQVESVAWITELKNTQSGLFYVVAVWCFLKSKAAEKSGRQTQYNEYYTLTLLCGALAMASKSSTVVLPAVLALCAWWTDRQLRGRDILRIAPLLLISATAAAVSYWTQKLEGAGTPEWGRSWPERIIIAGKAVWFYLGKLAWPHPLIFIYPKWQIDVSNIWSYLPVLGVAIVLVLSWRNRERWGGALFLAFAYFLIALSPVLGLVNHFFLRYGFVGDHFQYLASVGPLALAASTIVTGLGLIGKRDPWMQSVVGGGLLLILATVSWRQIWMYHSSEILWRTTLAKNPDCWMAHNNLGLALKQQGKTEEAVKHFDAALRINPSDTGVYINLGIIYAEANELDRAIQDFRAAVRYQPANIVALTNLGHAFAQKEDYDQAISYYKAAIEAAPGSSLAFYNLATLLARLRRYEEAVGYYQAALRLKPNDAETLNSLGNLFLEHRKLDQAVFYYTKAIRVRPDYAEAHNNLGIALAGEEKLEDAIKEFAQALRHKPDYAEAHCNLGSSLAAQRKFDEAIGHYREALRLKANYVEGHYNLGCALLELGQREESVTQLREAVRLKPDYAAAKEKLRALGIQPSD